MNSAATTVESRYRYTPFGDTAATASSVDNRARFAGRELDTETGLYFNRARYYDPQVGRFISGDPAGLAGGMNPYVFAGNDPVNGRDPSGNVCEWREVASAASTNTQLRAVSSGTRTELWCSELGFMGGSGSGAGGIGGLGDVSWWSNPWGGFWGLGDPSSGQNQYSQPIYRASTSPGFDDFDALVGGCPSITSKLRGTTVTPFGRLSLGLRALSTVLFFAAAPTMMGDGTVPVRYAVPTVRPGSVPDLEPKKPAPGGPTNPCK